MDVVETGSLDGRARAGAVIVAESGCDIGADEAAELGVCIVPMHVHGGPAARSAETMHADDIEAHVVLTGRPPTTSATTPGEYREAFERLRRVHPSRYIVHLAYSAQTTASYANALIASEGIPDVVHVDTRTASVGQGSVVRAVAKYLRGNPCADHDGLLAYIQSLLDRLHFGFVPASLDYLRAGGRLSVAGYVGASLLRMKPLIELVEGKVVCTKKLRGSMDAVCERLARSFPAERNIDPETLFLAYSDGLPQHVRDRVSSCVAAWTGGREVAWHGVHGVVLAHCGPGAFGIGGFARA